MNRKGTSELWAQLRQQTKSWRNGALPGLVMIACVLVARATGSLQVLEWMAFDHLLRLRPLESADPRVVIIGINETDIKTIGDYPIPDEQLAKALNILLQAQPRAIGLDVFRDLNTGKDRTELARIFKTSPNLIGIETALGSQASLTVKPPPELPPSRVGIADALLDPDGKLRRGLLASKVDSGEIKYSLPLLLAARYLKAEGIAFKPGARASDPIYLGNLRLPRFRPNMGGYVGARAGGNQILLNFRSHPQPFQIFSLTDVLTGKVGPAVIRDRVILIGMTAASVNDTFMTSATKGTFLSNALESLDHYQVIYGVEYQAHATSQLINAALDGRPLLHSWSEGVEYVWILSWGLLGIALGLLLQSPWKTLISVTGSSLGLIGICYGLMVLSWWVPLVPALLALYMAGLTTFFFDHNFRLLLEQRSLTLKRTYDAVHNGPLQTLAAILRSLDETPLPILRLQLQALNQELREVYESMNQALLTGEMPYSEKPIQELLYEIYDSTLQRNLPGFASVKTFIPPDFSPLQECHLTPDQKQGLCIFLQEALCNVGKHAVNATCLDVVCKRDRDRYSLQIIDNGIPNGPQFSHPSNGRGTDQAKELAKSLRGKFLRRSHTPQGVICELSWQGSQPWWSFFARPWLAISQNQTTPTQKSKI